MSIADWTKLWAEKKGIPCVFYKKIDSTNNQAKRKNLDKYRLFIAEIQSFGRGQKTRRWINSDLMLSWNFHLKAFPQPQFSILQAKALSLALNEVWNVPVKVKHPNDIYIGDRKLAGFLIEVISQSQFFQLIIGVGMNVFSHPELKEVKNGKQVRATHLQKHLNKNRINNKEWNFFLDYWYKNILNSISKFI